MIQMCISFFEAEEAMNPKPRVTAKPVQTLQESWAKVGCAGGAVGGEGGKERARTEPRKEEVWLGMQTM